MQHLKKLAPFVTAFLVFAGFEYILIDALVIDGYFKSTWANVLTFLSLTWMVLIYIIGHLSHRFRKPETPN